MSTEITHDLPLHTCMCCRQPDLLANEEEISIPPCKGYTSAQHKCINIHYSRAHHKQMYSTCTGVGAMNMGFIGMWHAPHFGRRLVRCLWMLPLCMCVCVCVCVCVYQS